MGVRNGADAYIFIDGVSQALTKTTDWATLNDPPATTRFTIGAQLHAAAAYFTNGWIDEVRISKGVARFTADFTPLNYEYGGTPTSSFKQSRALLGVGW
jgi:hypothetical protein